MSILNIDVNRALGSLHLTEVGSTADVPNKRLGGVDIHVYIGLVKQSHGGKDRGWCPVRANMNSPHHLSWVCWMKTYVYMNIHTSTLKMEATFASEA